MVKSPDAFRTIREVAEWLDTPAHVLRFWESRFAQVKPVKRAGGRRYYRPSDMELLGGIKQLLHEDGLTIRGVQKLLREHGVRHVAAKSPALGLEPTEKRAMSDPEGGAERPAGPAAPDPAQGPDHAEAPPPRAVANAGAFHAAASSHGPTQEPGSRPAAGAPAHGQATGSEAGPASPMAEGAVSGPPPPTAAAPSASQPAPGEASPPAGTPGPRPATEAAPPAGRPILPALWERRRSGDLGGAGAALARARALLRSMDARD